MEKRQLWLTFTADVARNEAEGLAKKQAVEQAAKEKAKHDVGAHDGAGFKVRTSAPRRTKLSIVDYRCY